METPDNDQSQEITTIKETEATYEHQLITEDHDTKQDQPPDQKEPSPEHQLVIKAEEGSEVEEKGDQSPDSKEEASPEHQLVTKGKTEEAHDSIGSEVGQKKNQSLDLKEEVKEEGGYEYKFVTESLREENDYKCPICLFIPRVPAKVECCGRIFCHVCITKHKEKGCPVCRKSFKCIKDKSLEHKIDRLQVHCIHRDKGCRWTGDLRYAQQHLEKATPASFWSLLWACQWMKCLALLWRGAAVTNMGQCDYEPTTCKKCDKELLYGKLDYHSKNECKHRSVPCEFQFAGCEYECPEMGMPQHIQDNTVKHLTLVSKHIKSKHCKINHLGIILAVLFLIIMAWIHLPSTNITISKELESDLMELSETVTSNKEVILSLQKDLELQSGKETSNEEAIRSLQKNLESQSGKVTSVIGSLQNDILEIQQKLTQLEGYIEDLQSKMRKSGLQLSSSGVLPQFLWLMHTFFYCAVATSVMLIIVL